MDALFQQQVFHCSAWERPLLVVHISGLTHGFSDGVYIESPEKTRLLLSQGSSCVRALFSMAVAQNSPVDEPHTRICYRVCFRYSTPAHQELLAIEVQQVQIRPNGTEAIASIARCVNGAWQECVLAPRRKQSEKRTSSWKWKATSQMRCKLWTTDGWIGEETLWNDLEKAQKAADLMEELVREEQQEQAAARKTSKQSAARFKQTNTRQLASQSAAVAARSETDADDEKAGCMLNTNACESNSAARAQLGTDSANSRSVEEDVKSCKAWPLQTRIPGPPGLVLEDKPYMTPFPGVLCTDASDYHHTEAVDSDSTQLASTADGHRGPSVLTEAASEPASMSPACSLAALETMPLEGESLSRQAPIPPCPSGAGAQQNAGYAMLLCQAAMLVSEGGSYFLTAGTPCLVQSWRGESEAGTLEVMCSVLREGDGNLLRGWVDAKAFTPQVPGCALPGTDVSQASHSRGFGS